MVLFFRPSGGFRRGRRKPFILTRRGTPNPVTLTAATFSFTGASLNVVVGRNITLTPATFAFTGSNLTALVARSITLTAGSFSLTGSNLTAQFTGNYNIVLTPATFSFAGQPLNVTKGGTSSPTGHGGRKKRELPYGWWEDKEPEQIEAAIEAAEIALEDAEQAIAAPREERRRTAFRLDNALEAIALNENIDRLAAMQAKQARAKLEAVAAEIAVQRKEFERLRVELEQEKKRRARMARLRDDDDAIAVLLS